MKWLVIMAIGIAALVFAIGYLHPIHQKINIGTALLDGGNGGNTTGPHPPMGDGPWEIGILGPHPPMGDGPWIIASYHI